MRTTAYGTAITSRGKHATIQGSTFSKIGYNAIKSTGPDARIVENRIDTFCLSMSDGGGIYLSGKKVAGSLVEGNTIYGKAPPDPEKGVYLQVEAGIYLDEHSNRCRIAGNRVSGSGRGIFLHNASDNILSGNVVSGSRFHAISLSEDAAAPGTLRRNNVVGNTIRSDGMSAISVKSATPVPAPGSIDGNTYIDGATPTSFRIESPGKGLRSMKIDEWTKNGFDVKSSLNPR
jgi:parallel beta-helix repeat protein